MKRTTLILLGVALLAAPGCGCCRNLFRRNQAPAPVPAPYCAPVCAPACAPCDPCCGQGGEGFSGGFVPGGAGFMPADGGMQGFAPSM